MTAVIVASNYIGRRSDCQGKQADKKWKSGFDRVDTNGDGDIDDMEWMELREMHGIKTQ
jgi:hypothetical protein